MQHKTFIMPNEIFFQQMLLTKAANLIRISNIMNITVNNYSSLLIQFTCIALVFSDTRGKLSFLRFLKPDDK